ncbi:MAG: hypothetical protein JXQ99_01620 [Hyphomicrobiaceae bacterium]
MRQHHWPTTIAFIAAICGLILGTLPAGAQTIDILALGASNTYGKGVSRQQAYPRHLQNMLRARGLKARVRNAGINGNTTGRMRARLRGALRPTTRLVILQPGGNDRRRGISRSTRRANIQFMKSYLRQRGIAVVMLPNRLIGAVARHHPRPDGQHFLGNGYRALAARLVPRVLQAIPRR